MAQVKSGVAFVQENEIFLASCSFLAMSGQGCPEKPLLSKEANQGRLRELPETNQDG